MEEKRFWRAFGALQAMKQITQAQFSREVGTSQSQMSQTINGTGRYVPVHWFSVLCRYGVSAEWLLTGKGEMFNKQLTLL